MKTQTYLPIFSGFYNTIWEMQTDNFCYSESVNFDDLDIDYNSYNNDVAQSIADSLTDKCEFIKSIKIEFMNSPKYYNFRNDSFNVEIDYKVKEFAKYLKENKQELDKYLREKYTSCSGFISHYSNSYEDWKIETNNFQNLKIDLHRLGSLLEFYFLNEYGQDLEMDLYYDFTDCHSEYEYINIIPKEDEDDAISLLTENQDFDFGYLGLLIREYKSKYPDYWIERLVNDEEKLIVKELKNI